MDLTATWQDLAWLASKTALPIVAKGILTAEDALLAAEHGAKAVVVSTHGGRNLDTTLAPIEALPEVAEAAKGRIEVYMDGGVRRGTDVLKALALGARAVLIGRPIFWGLAAGGERGLKSMMEMLRDELDLAMALTGCPTTTSIDRSLVTSVRPPHSF
jgi:isopentenyl diphosphate isomerase/L-lactate dehydrogenase-like FMN-dependent dehydrogenase